MKSETNSEVIEMTSITLDDDVFYVSEELVSKIKHSEQVGGSYTLDEMNEIIDDILASMK